jgi:predicted ATPase
MKDATETMPDLGSLNSSSWRLALLAQAQVEIGEWLAAEKTCAHALNLVKQTTEGWCLAEVHRIAATVILAKPGANLSTGEERLRETVQLAQKQGAKWWELRATTSLSRLLAKQGHCDEARAMLAEIYNWFTEGFDTAT